MEPYSGNEEILRTAARIIVLKEQEHLKKLQQHLQENSLLKADLQRATKEIRWMDETIISLRDELADAEDKLKKRDEKIISLQQSVNGQKEEVQKLEQSWQQEVTQLKELLAERDECISKVEQKREKRTAAYINVLGLLTSAQAALKEQEQKCAGLEEQHQIWLAKQQVTFPKELGKRDKSLLVEVKSREENLQKDLNLKEEPLQKEVKRKEMSLQKEIKHREELSLLCRQRQEKPGSRTESQPQLEEMPQMKEALRREQDASNKEKVLRLSDLIFQLQVNYLSFSWTCFSSLWNVLW